MRIKADRDVCIGAGQCVLTEPAVFDQDDDGIVVLLTDQPDDRASESVRDAIDLCPSHALSAVAE